VRVEYASCDWVLGMIIPMVGLAQTGFNLEIFLLKEEEEGVWRVFKI